MKKLLSILFTSAISLSCIFSCGKDDTTKNSLEGTWGLIHEEGYMTVDGVKNEEVNRNFNPIVPRSDSDTMIKIIMAVDNMYLVDYYYWNNKTSKWEICPPARVTWTIKGNKIYGEEAKEDQFLTFKLSSDTFSYEGYLESEEDGYLYNSSKEKVKVVSYINRVYRKMSEQFIGIVFDN